MTALRNFDSPAATAIYEAIATAGNSDALDACGRSLWAAYCDGAIDDADAETLMAEVRNWLRSTTDRILPSANELWERFKIFRDDLADALAHRRYSERDVQALEPVEYIDIISDWKAGTL